MERNGSLVIAFALVTPSRAPDFRAVAMSSLVRVWLVRLAKADFVLFCGKLLLPNDACYIERVIQVLADQRKHSDVKCLKKVLNAILQGMKRHPALGLKILRHVGT